VETTSVPGFTDYPVSPCRTVARLTNGFPVVNNSVKLKLNFEFTGLFYVWRSKTMEIVGSIQKDIDKITGLYKITG